MQCFAAIYPFWWMMHIHQIDIIYVVQVQVIYKGILERLVLRALAVSRVITFVATNQLGGGFKYFLFSPLPGEMIQFD